MTIYSECADTLSKKELRLIRQYRKLKRKERQSNMENDIIDRANDVIQLALNQQNQQQNQPQNQPQNQQQNQQVSRQPGFNQQTFSYAPYNSSLSQSQSKGRYQGVGTQTGCTACKRRLFDPI